MVFPTPPQPSDVIRRGDMDIIACQRTKGGGTDSHNRTFGIRWISRPDIGYPEDGYVVECSVDGGAPEPVGPNNGVFYLPKTDDWSQFAQDVEDRRPLAGPYFPPADITEANLGFLLPLIRLVDPRTLAGEAQMLTKLVAGALGHSHEEDAELALTFWPDGDPPPLAQLLSATQTADRLIAFYRTQAFGFLLALAIRFEYAVLFGLATDNHVTKGRDVVYQVTARWDTANGTIESNPTSTNQFCAPNPPAYLKAEMVPGSVAHPAFNDFTGWTPPDELLAQDSNQTLQTAESVIPRAPAGITALEWAAPPQTGRLIDHEPVLYEIKRFHHGTASAALSNPPPAPADADYAPIHDGELLLRSDQPPHALDRFGMPWPDMEGYYHYQVRGVDLLGVKSPQAAVAWVRHHDDIPPPAPGVRLAHEQPIKFDDENDSKNVDLIVNWRGAHDFVGPDAVEFRVSARWRARRAVHAQIQSVTPEAGSDLTGVVTMDQVQVPANRLAGMRLIVADGEYPIIEHGNGAGATMRIRRVARRLPAPGQDALVYDAGDVLAEERIAKFPRRPAVSALISNVQQTNPLRFGLTAAGIEAIPQGEDFSLYVHILRTSFRAISEGGGTWRIDRPQNDDPRRESWDHWLSLSDPAGLASGSPTIVFPDHLVTVSVSPPANFRAGILMLDVTAADDASYVDSPNIPATEPPLANLKGNESDPTTASISARVMLAPDAPQTPPYDPARFIWAETAAKYAEEAEYLLQWPVVDAAHYEVWRVLEGALDGVTPSTDDQALRALAISQADKFALRSLKVFGPRYRDTLPGRAPTRAVYRVRGVNEAGVAGPWSDLIGPVHVPDVRQPPAPNLSRVVAPKPGEDDPQAAERRLILEWTQPGPKEELRFEIELQNRNDEGWSVVGVLPPGSLPEPGPARLYRHTVSGLIPGEKRAIRVIAVREARDPVDPFGQLRRNIRSLPSETRAGRAIGAVTGPLGVTGAALSGGGAPSIALNWSNQDPYSSIEILRQGPEEFRLRRIAGLDGASENFLDTGITPGLWYYQVRIRGYSRVAESEIVEVEVP